MLFFSSTKNYIKRFSVKIVMLPNLRTKLGRGVFLIFHPLAGDIVAKLSFTM